MRGIAQRARRAGEALACQALAVQHIDKVKVDGKLAIGQGRYASDRDIVIAVGFPVGKLHTLDARRIGQHARAWHGMEAATALQVVLDDGGDIKTAVARVGAREGHDGDRNGIGDAGGDLNLKLRAAQSPPCRGRLRRANMRRTELLTARAEVFMASIDRLELNFQIALEQRRIRWRRQGRCPKCRRLDRLAHRRIAIAFALDAH